MALAIEHRCLAPCPRIHGTAWRQADVGTTSAFTRVFDALWRKSAALPILLLLLLLPLTAQAQDLPSRSIRIIVPNPPGGAGDISARVIGQKLSESLRQPVVVENQAGASGAIGMNLLKRAAPDGSTIGVVISLAQTIDLIQNKTASFDLAKDFTPITAIADNPAGLVVNSTVAATTLSAFIDLVRRRPGEISYGSAG